MRTHHAVVPLTWPASLEEPEWTDWLEQFTLPLRMFLTETVQEESETSGVIRWTTVSLDAIPDALRNAEIEQDGERPVRLRVTLDRTHGWTGNGGSAGRWEHDTIDVFAEPAKHGQATYLYLEEK
jgi:hypothetical protein